MAKPLDEPLGVVPRDELADDLTRLCERLKAMEIAALLLEGRGGLTNPDPTGRCAHRLASRAELLRRLPAAPGADGTGIINPNINKKTSMPA